MFKKTFNVLMCVIVAVPLLFFSCQTENYEPQDEQHLIELKKQLEPVLSQDLPTEVKNQLELTQQNLEKHLGGELSIEQVTVLGKLSSEKSLKSLPLALANKESFVATGNIMQASTVVMGRLHKLFPEELEGAKQAIQEVVSEEIETGDMVMEITWKYKNEIYTTQCFYRNTGIVWDNVITGLFMMAQEPTEEITSLKVSSRSTSRSWRANWLWGSKRGEMGYRITIYYSGSSVRNTDVSDWGYISLGKARSESKIVKNSGSYGKCRYALGLCTPVGSLSFNHSNFSVSFSGLGSNMIANGYKSLYP